MTAKTSTTTMSAVVEMTIAAAQAYGREDLAFRVAQTRRRLDEPTVRVMVVGEFKQGKSSLVNAMLNAPICPVDDDIATSVHTVVRHADEPQAHLVHGSVPGQDATSSERGGFDRRGPGGGDRHQDSDGHVEPIEFDQLPVYASELGNPGNERALLAVEIGLPRRLLKSGLVLVDTPGVGGLGSAHTAATIAAMPTADVMLFVSDASQEMTRSELEFLQAAGDVCPNTAFVMTKIDFYPDWKQIRELNRGHVDRLRTSIPVFATSAALRLKAIESDDHTLNTESGYQELIQHLLSTSADLSSRRNSAVADDLRSVVGQLIPMFEGERQILENPSQMETVTATFKEAKERCDVLRSQAARWQVTLGDGVADLTTDFDHRLKGRLRRTALEAEAAIEEQDPGDVWEEFAEWLKRRVSHDLAQTYVELARQAQDLSAIVAEHFDDGQAALHVHLDPTGALTRAAAIAPRASIEQERVGAGSKAMTAMRGSYGGLLMFGMVAQMAGLAMLNPATALVGALMGRKAVKDDRERQLLTRRQQARITARQFIDDTGFEVGKAMKDSLRGMQRQLRDHYQDRAEELNRSVATSLAAAKESLKHRQQERDQRLRDVRAELARLDQLSAAIDELSKSGQAAGTP